MPNPVPTAGAAVGIIGGEGCSASWHRGGVALLYPGTGAVRTIWVGA